MTLVHPVTLAAKCAAARDATDAAHVTICLSRNSPASMTDASARAMRDPSTRAIKPGELDADPVSRQYPPDAQP